MKSLIRQPRPRKAVAHRIPKKCRAVKTFDVFEELFADDFVDHIPRPNTAFGNSSDDYRRAGSANQFLNK